jgi:hypothetical protein
MVVVVMVVVLLLEYVLDVEPLRVDLPRVLIAAVLRQDGLQVLHVARPARRHELFVGYIEP